MTSYKVTIILGKEEEVTVEYLFENISDAMQLVSYNVVSGYTAKITSIEKDENTIEE